MQFYQVLQEVYNLFTKYQTVFCTANVKRGKKECQEGSPHCNELPLKNSCQLLLLVLNQNMLQSRKYKKQQVTIRNKLHDVQESWK